METEEFQKNKHHNQQVFRKKISDLTDSKRENTNMEYNHSRPVETEDIQGFRQVIIIRL